jgi:hypothetical protein
VPTLQRRTGVIIIAVMVAAVLFLSIPGQQMWRKVLQDSGHGPVFAVIALALALMRAANPATGRRSLAVLLRSFLVAIGIGVLTEAVQHFQPGRFVSLLDLMHDAAGAAFGLALLAILERRPSAGLRPTSPASGRGEEPSPGLGLTSPASGRGEGKWAWTVALAAFAILAWQPLECARAYARRAAALPTLATGAEAVDLYFVRSRNATLQRTFPPERFRRAGDEAALYVAATPGSRPALELFEPYPDWRGHATLAIDLTNPGEDELRLILRILDARHNWEHRDRLNLPLVIPAHERATIRVAVAAVEAAPAGRRMDLSQITNVMLFSPAPTPGTGFYVSRIWLE